MNGHSIRVLADEGSAAIEYAILASGIAAVVVSMATLVGGQVVRYFMTFWTAFMAH